MVQLQIWVVVENNTVCLAASLPALRPLLRKNGANDTSAYGHETDAQRSKSYSQNHTGRKRRNLDSDVGRKHGGSSEEYILASLGDEAGDRITKTTAVSVAYEERDASESGQHDHGIRSLAYSGQSGAIGEGHPRLPLHEATRHPR